jgi:uncharacterized membrane protein YgaE (UPF0421/DUF939 family)
MGWGFLLFWLGLIALLFIMVAMLCSRQHGIYITGWA